MTSILDDHVMTKLAFLHRDSADFLGLVCYLLDFSLDRNVYVSGVSNVELCGPMAEHQRICYSFMVTNRSISELQARPLLLACRDYSTVHRRSVGT